jgi:hypothetical protein
MMLGLFKKKINLFDCKELKVETKIEGNEKWFLFYFILFRKSVNTGSFCFLHPYVIDFLFFLIKFFNVVLIGI